MEAIKTGAIGGAHTSSSWKRSSPEREYSEAVLSRMAVSGCFHWMDVGWMDVFSLVFARRYGLFPLSGRDIARVRERAGRADEIRYCAVQCSAVDARATCGLCTGFAFCCPACHSLQKLAPAVLDGTLHVRWIGAAAARRQRTDRREQHRSFASLLSPGPAGQCSAVLCHALPCRVHPDQAMHLNPALYRPSNAMRFPGRPTGQYSTTVQD